MIRVGNGTETVWFQEVEHVLVTREWDSVTLRAAACLVALLILVLNGSILKFILKQTTKTFLDWMIVIDSCLCLGHILGLAMSVSDVSSDEAVCVLKIGIWFFLSILNRLLSVLIVMHRAIYVLKPQLVDTSMKRRTLSFILIGLFISLSLGSTVGMAIYREKYISFKSKLLLIFNSQSQVQVLSPK